MRRLPTCQLRLSRRLASPCCGVWRCAVPYGTINSPAKFAAKGEPRTLRRPRSHAQINMV
eukprot:scaffold30840_cov36-Cyclotella_meneghiniana.AAC.3